MDLFPSPGKTIRLAYDSLSRVPGGKTVFSKLVGLAAPYTGSIGAQVVEVRPGYAKVQLADRRAVRNHLNCIHAVALVNLAEETTGLAMTYGLPENTRGILAGLSIDYLKKARGTLTAICRCDVPQTNERQHCDVVGEIFDTSGDLVARATAKWLLGPSGNGRKE